MIKHREIAFCPLHPEADQARAAALLLEGADGVLELVPRTPERLRLSYELTRITLQDIESALSEQGFHLDNSLLTKLHRALIYYTEETERANLGCAVGRSNCTRDIFVERYRRAEHGCRDPRPDHWRTYL